MHRPEIGTEKHHSRWLEAIMPASTLAHDFAKAHGGKVSEVMSDTVILAAEETPLGEIALLLEKHRIKHVPVLRDGMLVGTVSRSNLIQALAASHIAVDADAESDRAIRLNCSSGWRTRPGRISVRATSSSATAWCICGGSSAPTTSARR